MVGSGQRTHYGFTLCFSMCFPQTFELYFDFSIKATLIGSLFYLPPVLGWIISISNFTIQGTIDSLGGTILCWAEQACTFQPVSTKCQWCPCQPVIVTTGELSIHFQMPSPASGMQYRVWLRKKQLPLTRYGPSMKWGGEKVGPIAPTCCISLSLH